MLAIFRINTRNYLENSWKLSNFATSIYKRIPDYGKNQ